MSFDIFVVTYRVTNSLPKLVYMLFFSTKKLNFHFWFSPLFGLCGLCRYALPVCAGSFVRGASLVCVWLGMCHPFMQQTESTGSQAKWKRGTLSGRKPGKLPESLGLKKCFFCEISFVWTKSLSYIQLGLHQNLPNKVFCAQIFNSWCLSK